MKLVKIISLFVFIISGLSLMGQTLNDAGEKFNEGLKLEKEKNFQEAIKAYEHCIVTCNKLGDTAVMLMKRSNSQLSKIYFDLGLESYKSKKPDEAIKLFAKAYEYADNIKDTKQKNKCYRYINYVYTYKGNVLNANNDFENALKMFEEANKYYKKNSKTFYGMEISYAKLDNEESMKQAANNVIKMDKDGSKTANNAKEVAGKYYISKVPAEVASQNYDKALELINKSFTFYSEDPSAYYYMALCYNELGNYSGAIRGAQAGLSLGGDDQQILNYELARAYEGTGDNAQACEKYNLAKDGANDQISKSAADKISQLGCN